MGGDDDLRDLWRAQPTREVPAMSMEAVQARSEKLARRVKLRKWQETIAGVVGGVVLVALTARGPHAPLVTAACALLVAGEAVVLAAIWRRSRMKAAPPDGTTAEVLAHYRGELVREREALMTVAWWYVGPVLPGLLLFPVAVCVEVGIRAVTVGVVSAVATVGVCAIIVWVNRRAARKVGREIEALDGPHEA